MVIGRRAWAFRRARASRKSSELSCEKRGCEKAGRRYDIWGLHRAGQQQLATKRALRTDLAKN
eukprot:6618065-Alexandrium_andersonii.AAC.1